MLGQGYYSGNGKSTSRESAPVRQTDPTIAWGLFSYEQWLRLFVFDLNDRGPQGCDDNHKLFVFLFRDIEFVQSVDQVLRDDGKFAGLDAKSGVGLGRRTTDDLAGTPGDGTDQVLVFLAEAFA